MLSSLDVKLIEGSTLFTLSHSQWGNLVVSELDVRSRAWPFILYDILD